MRDDAGFPIPSGEVRKGRVHVEFVDQYGDKRIIHRLQGAGGRLAVKRQGNSPCLAMNRVIGAMIGKKIRAQREVAGLSLAGLCRRAGIVSATPKNRMYEIEMGRRQDGIRLGTLYAIAAALGVPPGDLLPDMADVLSAAKIDFVSSEPSLGSAITVGGASDGMNDPTTRA